MPPGRQFYDPIVQPLTPTVPAEEVERVEMWVDEEGRWNAHHVGPDGLVVETAPGSVNREDVELQCRALWPQLLIHEVREGQDSTWVGHVRPSPRAWQQQAPEAQLPDLAAPSADQQQEVAGFQVEKTGTYLHIDDFLSWLEAAAEEYDQVSNPSAALALRAVAEALRG